MSDEIVTKFIRLVTGEDIIANCMINEDIQCVDIDSPMKVIINRFNAGGKSMLIMMPWLPLEVVADEYATLKFEDILTMVDPKDTFVEYYNDTVDKYQQLIETNSDEKLFEEAYEEEFGDGPDEEHFNQDDIEIEKILASMKDTKKRLLH
jgi:hypothetical protein